MSSPERKRVSALTVRVPLRSTLVANSTERLSISRALPVTLQVTM